MENPVFSMGSWWGAEYGTEHCHRSLWSVEDIEKIACPLNYELLIETLSYA